MHGQLVVLNQTRLDVVSARNDLFTTLQAKRALISCSRGVDHDAKAAVRRQGDSPT